MPHSAAASENPRRPLRRVWFFLPRFAVVFALLLLARPFAGEWYVRVCRSVGELVFGRWSQQVSVRLPPAQGGALDTQLQLLNWQTLQPDGKIDGHRWGISFHHLGYLPTAFLGDRKSVV